MNNQRIKEIKKRIADLKETLFYIDMIDRWTQQNEKEYQEVCQEIKELELLLAKAIVEE